MNQMKMTVGLVLLCLIWGLNWVAIKISLETITPFTSAAVRFLLGTACLLFYVRWKKVSLRLEPLEFRYMFISAFLMYPIDYGLIYWGEQYLSAGVSAIFFSTFALFTAFFSDFVFKSEMFNWRKYAGIFFGLGGVFLIFYDQLVITHFNTMVMLGALAVLLSAVAAALSTVIVKKHLFRVDPVSLSFHQMALGTLFMVILALLLENINPGGFSPRAIVAMLYMSILSSAVAFILYYKLLKQMAATSLSFIIYVIPVIALIGDFFIYGEMLSLRSVIGMGVIFSGIWLSRGR